MDNTALVFFGGCTGVGKSSLLKQALEKYDSSEYCIIRISDFFNECRRSDTGNDKDFITWNNEHWKEYDKQVLESLKKAIENNEKKLVVINQHFATISPSGYLPGIDLKTLDLLLGKLKELNKSNNCIKKSKNVISDGPHYSFGVILIDTAPNVMIESHSNQLSDSKSILGYISNENILKDLEENRKWAGIYSTRALSVLDSTEVLSDTIYIYDLKKKTSTINEIVNFFSNFGLSKI